MQPLANKKFMAKVNGDQLIADTIEVSSIETLEAEKAGLTPLYSFVPVAFDIDLTAIKEIYADVASWKLEGQELTLRVIADRRKNEMLENRIPPSGSMSLYIGNEYGNPDEPRGKMEARFSEVGKNEAGYDYFIVRYKLREDHVERFRKFFEKYSFNKSLINESQAIVEKFREAKTSASSGIFTARKVIFGLVLAVLVGAKVKANMAYNSLIECSLMAEGRPLDQGDYRFPAISNAALNLPAFIAEEAGMTLQTGNIEETVARRIAICREQFGYQIPPTIAKKSLKK